jgi:UDP-glucose 4-epimerase
MDESHPLLPSTPYAASKVSADHVVLSYILTFGIDAVVVRPFNNFGPRQNPGTYAGIIPIVINRVRKGEPVTIHGDGEQTRDFIFAPHTADALVRVYDAPATRGKVINVATGHETSIKALVAMLLDVLGVPEHPVVHTPPRPGDVRRHCGDVRLFRELIGFEPPALSRVELAETVDWYLKSGNL